MIKKIILIIGMACGIYIIPLLSSDAFAKGKAASDLKQWVSDFSIEKRTFSTKGENRFFILKPGFRLIFENKKEKVIITVLNETKKIGNIETRILEERESKKGEMVEISRNYFAICNETKDVFYFGEEVDIYKDGKVTSHSGAWQADEKDSKAGIIIPGNIVIGAKYYQEISPGKAMDRSEIISTNETVETPAGTFKNCLKTEETSGLDPDEKGYKIYAPGIGLIKDGSILLTYYGYIKK